VDGNMYIGWLYTLCRRECMTWFFFWKLKQKTYIYKRRETYSKTTLSINPFQGRGRRFESCPCCKNKIT